MGGGGKGGGGGGGGDIPTNTTSTTKWDPPSYLGGKTGGLNSWMSYAAQTLGKPYNQYQGQTVAGPSNATQMGWQIAQQRALNGNPLAQYSDNVYKKTMNGDYMSPTSNPWLQQNIDYANQDVTRNYNETLKPQLDSASIRDGAFGGSSYNQQLNQANRTLGDQLSRNSAGMAFNNYNNERQNQIGMMGYADQAGNRDYNDAQQLMNIGQQKQQYLQGLFGQGQQDFNQANNFLYDNMNRFGGVMQPLMGQGGQTTTGTNPYAGMNGSNPWATALGIGQTGLGMYNMGKNLGIFGGATGGFNGYQALTAGLGSGAPGITLPASAGSILGGFMGLG